MAIHLGVSLVFHGNHSRFWFAPGVGCEHFLLLLEVLLEWRCCEHPICRQAAASSAAKVREQPGGAQRPWRILCPVTFATRNATTLQQSLTLRVPPWEALVAAQELSSGQGGRHCSRSQRMGTPKLAGGIHRRITMARGASTAFLCPSAQRASWGGMVRALAVLTSTVFFTCLTTVRPCRRPKPHGCATWATAASSVVNWKWKLWPLPMLCVVDIWGLSVQGCQRVVIQADQRLPPNGGGGI